MKVTQTSLPGVFFIEPEVFPDDRGFFLETHNQQRYPDAGLDVIFRQDNHSHSKKGVLRGLHYQLNHPQGKLVYAVTGEIFDVAVDIRKGSPTFGKWTGAKLSSENHKQLYVPPGFAHGFCVLSDVADVIYKCTEIFHPGDDYGILWSDETVAIDWPTRKNLIISDKDRKNPSLKDLPENLLPRYQS
jgi:dTDP-4-dehydrorhamnose 3,5-epimerase